MFPLDSFRLARTLAATAAGVLACSVALAAAGAPLRATLALAVLGAAAGYAARYDARNVRAQKRARRPGPPRDPWRPIIPTRTQAMEAFAMRELAALEAGRVTPTPALTLVDLEAKR